MTRRPVPPFSFDDAVKKVRMAEDAWNTRDPERVALAYTPNTEWRNRSEFLNGRDEVRDFLTRKWTQENEYRLIKEIWEHGDDRIAVRFCYEYHDANGNWFHAYGNKNWKFDNEGYMTTRHASINNVLITGIERLFHWPLGPRPEKHGGLSELRL